MRDSELMQKDVLDLTDRVEQLNDENKGFR